MTSPRYDFDTGISLRDAWAKVLGFVRVVRSERATVVRFGALGLAIGLVFAFGSGEEYTAQARILPYRSGGGGSGGLAGLAGLAGIRLQTSGVGQTITADLYPEVAKSQDFRIRLAETPLTFGTLGRSATAIEYFRSLRQTPVTDLIMGYTIGLPGRIVSTIRQATRPSRSVPADTGLAAHLPVFDQAYLEQVDKLASRLSVSIDRRTSIITITGRMPDAYASADLVRVTADQLMSLVITYESQAAGEQFHFVDTQLQQAKLRYERAQRALATFADRNRSLMSATAEIERDRLQREHDLAFEVYQQMSRELEQARIKMSQDTPVFTVLERASVPTVRSSPKRARLLVQWLLLGVVVGIGRIGFRRLSPGPTSV